MGDRVKAYPLSVWLFTAMTAPVVQFLAAKNWLGILAVGGLCSLLCFSVMVISEGECSEKRWYCGAQLIFLIPVISLAAKWNAECWPTGNAAQEMGLVMIVIAAAAVWNGGERSSRANAVLFWFVALLYAAVLISGGEDVKASCLIPKKWDVAMAAFVFLVPTVITFLPREGFKVYKWTLVWCLGFAVLISVLTVGSLSQGLAEQFRFPFYEYSKSLKLFGIAQRLESLVSVAITMGYFSLLSLLLSGVWHLTDALAPGKGKWGVGIGGGLAVAGTYIIPDIPAVWLASAAICFWGILPMFSIQNLAKKRSKNNEKKP